VRQAIVLQVNSERHYVSVRPGDTLAQVLRERLLLTGTKEGCGMGECGACSVLLDGRAVNSCLVLAVDAEGHEIVTIEGLGDRAAAAEGRAADGTLTLLQEAFVEHGAIHCGFCTPGMVVTATDYLENSPRRDREALMRAIEGNVCRCTGYITIVAAIESAQAAIEREPAALESAQAAVGAAE